MTLGLDFGTTNSIISYWDGTKPVPYAFGQQTYTPSAIVYEDKEVVGVGQDALTYWSSNHQKAKLCRFFKTLLTTDNPEKWKAVGWAIDKSPYEVAKEYIEQLLVKSSHSIIKNRGMAIEDLVVSVPELWQRGVVNQGAENLMKILRDDLKLPVRQLLSEPVAAVAYYIWKSQLAEGAKKRILVCDMGGGTFDVALCEASRNTVSVIDFDGNDSNQAGVSDLKGILRNVYGRAERPIDETSFEFIRDLWDLDRNIVMDANGRKLELAYRNYENSPERYGAMPVFNSGELSVTAADAFEAFDGIYKGIHTVLNKIKQRQGGHLEFDQLLMVGGFSQYFLVRKTILDYFKLAETHEKVKIIPRNDSLFAISYGATLVAANQVEIKELYPHSIFYIGYSWSQQEVEIPIITAGKEIKPDTPHFAKQEVKIIGNDFDLKGYVQMEGDAKRQQEFKKPVKLNFKADLDKRYKIGIEINRSNMAVCVIRDAANQEHKIPLGELFKKGIYPVTD